MSSPACCSPEKSMENSRLQAQRSNESPSGAFKRQNGLAPARWRGFAPTSSATMHRMQTMQGKTRLSRRCAKSVQKCAEPQKMENPRRILRFLVGFCALEGTRIPGPLIKRAHRAEHSDFRSFEFMSFFVQSIVIFCPAISAPSVVFCKSEYPLHPLKPCKNSAETVHLLWDK